MDEFLTGGTLNIHTDIRKRLYNYYVNKKIPHILFYGEHGCGKKTLVEDFIYLIYGGDKQKIKQNTYYSICSHSKGIKHIRENLKEYSRSNVRQEKNIYFKTIVLYNFENLSSDGQSALRRVIESYSNTTRFFLVLQNKEKILQPILSRFAHIYVPLPIVDGVPTNLHTYYLDKQTIYVPNTESIEEELSCIIKNYGAAAGAAQPPPNYKDFIRVSENLYSRAFSCIDLMDYLKKIMDEEKMAKITMNFNKVKSEFRNEKMMILYILTLLYN